MSFPIVASRYDYVNVFFNNLAPLVVNEYVRRKDKEQKCLYPSTVLAMAALESGYNLNATTLFGIKGEGAVLDTTEYINGENIDIKEYYGFNNDTDIADKLNEIVEFNDIGNPDLIYVGENITLI